jgi:SAM-dependent methyltransferase
MLGYNDKHLMVQAANVKLPKGEQRSVERYLAHYEVETELAERLRRSTRADRTRYYSAIYNEMYQRVPDHPMLVNKGQPGALDAKVRRRLALFKRFVTRNSTFLEIGAGDGHMCRAMAKVVKKVYAVEVSEEIARGVDPPPNMEAIITDGLTLPVPEGTVSLISSDNVIEHIHPDDAADHISAICRALAPGGVCVCMTPNGLVGPFDISQGIDDEPRGFHLREYTYTELRRIFLQAGFSRVDSFIGGGGYYLLTPAWLHEGFERLLNSLPKRWRKPVGNTLLFRVFLGLRIIARK